VTDLILVEDYIASALTGDDVGSYVDVPAGDVSGVRFYVPPYMGTPAGFEVMTQMPALEVCQLPTAGFEHAFAYIPDGVTVCNAAGVHDASTAELAIGLILTSLRELDTFARAMPEGKWLAGNGISLADRRVLVVGAGGIGTALRRRLEPFECEVTVVGRTARDGVHGIAEIEELLPHADIVVLAVPLNDSTRGIVDHAFLARMRDGALLVNVARGGVVATDELVAEVTSGRLRAALDVTEPEPLPADHPLWRLPGAYIAPHVGGDSTAFIPRIQRLVGDQVGRWRRGEVLRNVVA
jgi:phosphoglycerate dehydrogenase-like enzyme